jgi:hypothetical protein
MPYKTINFFLFFLLLSCVNKTLIEEPDPISKKSFFLNKGFTLVYRENLNKNETISEKIDDRSLIIFQKNLKKNTSVKVTNLHNLKSILAKVGKKTKYPNFYNSVISKRISDELELNSVEPYIEIKEIIHGSSFIAKKAKIYDEEKKVAEKAPVDQILIVDIGNDSKKTVKVKKELFSYVIKIADFYFKKSAHEMETRILAETSIKKLYIEKLSSTKFRVFVGPYDNLNSLKKSFNAINVLEFDNIEIIKK